LAAGVQLTAEADRGDVVADEDFTVTIRTRCRPEIQCTFDAPHVSYAQLPERVRLADGQKEDVEKAAESSWIFAFSKAKGTAPPVIGAPGALPRLFPPLESALNPDGDPLLEISREVHIGDFSFSPEVKVTYTAASSTAVTRVPLRIVPAYTIAVDPKQTVEVLNAKHDPFNVFLRVHSYSTKPGKVTVGLDVPDGITASAPVELDFPGSGDQYAEFAVTPPANLAAGNIKLTAYAANRDGKFSTSLEPLPSMPTLLWSEPAQCVVHAFDINVPRNLHVGYISAEGEPIPDALRQLGIDVQMLDTAALAFGDLSHYNAIVVGVRAYELRPELAAANQRLLNYVSNGGTLVVQYNRDYIWDKLQPAPYPATIGTPTPRITDETSPVKFLKPDDPLLNKPNKITQADFQGWVQERGLYFWSKFDDRYTPLLAMNDPGEKDLNGALVYTRHGKGTYIYTGLAFFRELPEGVPGAYRLFVNLLSASNPH
jgi:hypothetical protein